MIRAFGILVLTMLALMALAIVEKETIDA